MNQNRNNNRRRGRGNNRGQGGGGHQGNRIDNRARGNAPQMLEKYRKLAHDASLNGDRVQTEYYLQFADHYFRVIADNRAQKEEGRPQRQPNERDGQDFDYEEEDDLGEAMRPRTYQTRRERDEEEEAQEGAAATEGEPAEPAAEEDANPFLRDRRGSAPAGRRGRSRSRTAAPAENAERAEPEADAGDAGFDPGLLPPSIARETRDEEAAPRPRRGRRPRSAPTTDEGDSEPLEAVG